MRWVHGAQRGWFEKWEYIRHRIMGELFRSLISGEEAVARPGGMCCNVSVYSARGEHREELCCEWSLFVLNL